MKFTTRVLSVLSLNQNSTSVHYLYSWTALELLQESQLKLKMNAFLNKLYKWVWQMKSIRWTIDWYNMPKKKNPLKLQGK